MSKVRTIDTHTHIMTKETAALLTKEMPKTPVTINPIDETNSNIDVGGAVYKPFPRGGYDIEQRLKDMDALGVNVHVLSVTPQTYLYDREPALAAVTSAIQNEQIARHIAAHPDRFMGIATLPMQAPDKAAEELTRSMTKLGLRGTMIGSNVMGKNLDDPSFEPLWAAAEKLGAFIFIHPTSVAAADRLKLYHLFNLIGNPLDTTIAAASLLFGGVFDRYPKLVVCLAHGGGYVPYQAGRWTHGWEMRQEPRKVLKQVPRDIIGKFYYDTILHSPEALAYMVERAGASRVLLGSDYPYDMAPLQPVKEVEALPISDADKATILGNRAAELLQGKPS